MSKVTLTCWTVQAGKVRDRQQGPSADEFIDRGSFIIVMKTLPTLLLHPRSPLIQLKATALVY